MIETPKEQNTIQTALTRNSKILSIEYRIVSKITKLVTKVDEIGKEIVEVRANIPNSKTRLNESILYSTG